MRFFIFLLIAGVLGNSVIALAQHGQISRRITIATVPNTSVASLPTCNASRNGDISNVTDALTPTVGATVAGGGAVTTLVHCNATNWIVG